MIKRTLVNLFTLLLLLGTVVHAQSDEKRMKIELTLKQGTNTTVASLSSTSLSFNKPYDAEVKEAVKEPARNFNLALNFDKPNIEVLRAFITGKAGLDGQIVITDTYGKLPPRKLEFKSGVLDAMSDQMCMTMRCAKLTIDGLKIEL